MDITQFRRQYPQYDTLSDHDLAQRLHSKYYADRVDFDTFARAFGVPAAPTVTVVEPPAEQPTDSLPTGPAIGAGEPSPVLRPFPGQPRTREQRARDFLDQIREDFTPQPEMRPEQPPSRVKRGLEQLFGRRGAVTPESSAEAILAAQAARHGMRPAQYAKEIGARTGLLERALEDLGSGAVGVGAGMLGYIARVADAEGLTVAAGEVQAQATDLLPPDPNFVDELLSGFGSTAMFFVPGMGIVRGATAVAQVAPRMAYWLGAGAAAGMEAATEAGLVYQERIDQGATPEEAAASADATFFANTPLLVVTNRLGLFADRGSRLMRRSLAGVIEGPGQEGPQQIISNLATGRPWDEGVLTSAAIGAIVGTTLGGARTPAEVAGDRFARGIERTEFEVPAEEVAAAMLQPPPREPDVASEADVADVLEAPTVDDAIEEAKDSVGVTTDAVEDVAQEQQVAAEQAAIEQQAATAITPPAVSYEPQAKQIADLMMQGRQDEAVALFEQTAAPLDETGVGELQARIQALRAAKERDAMTLETQRVPEDDTGPFPQPTNATQTRDQIAWNAQRLQSAERVAGERWPQAENVSDEERQAASNRARWLRQENESLRNLLRYYETPTTPQATPQPQEMVTPEEIPPAPREIPPVSIPPAPRETAQTSGKARYERARRIDSSKDDLLTAIAKAGGISRAEAEAQGIDPAEFNRPGWSILRVFTKQGDSFDGMAETLAQHGYVQGEFRSDDLAEKLDRALRGDRVLTAEGQMAVAEQDAYKRELAAEDLLEPDEYEGADADTRTFVDLSEKAIEAGVSEDTVERILERGAIEDLPYERVAAQLDAEIKAARERQPAAEPEQRAEPSPGPAAEVAPRETPAQTPAAPVERPDLELTPTAVPQPASTRPAPAQQGLFAPPTTAEEVAAAGRATDERLRGAGVPEAEGPGELFERGRTAQVDIADVATPQSDLRLRMLMLPEEVVEVEGTGERATVQESAAAAINRVDSKLEALYALRDCLRS